MKKYYFIFAIFCVSALSLPEFEELNKLPKVLGSDLNLASSSLQVVQKRWLPKRFLSELSLGVSPALKGFNNIHNYSIDAAYRFFINERWSFQLKYSRYFNSLTSKGEENLLFLQHIPLEAKYAQSQSYLGGIDWYPFYGKASFYNRLVRFDLYLSLLAGQIELLNMNHLNPLVSVGLGLVSWWHKNLNSRLELQGTYFNYFLSEQNSLSKPFSQMDIHEYSYRIYFSIGFLF